MSQEYTHFFSKLYDLSPTCLLSLILLIFFRLGPVVALAPFLGSKLPAPAKIGFLLALTVIFLPHVASTSLGPVTYDAALIGYAAKEFFLGFSFAFLINIPFQFAQSAGTLVDFLRGASSLQVSDPFSSAQTSPIGNLYNYMLVAIFYIIGGPFFFFDTLMTSYTLIPIDAFINPVFFSLSQPFWQVSLALATKVLALSIQLSAPSLLAILMTEVFLGIANRLAPQVQIAFLGMSVKSLLGLALLCLGWFFILQQTEKQTLLWLKEIDRILFSIPRAS
jgi:type III secretion protein T